MATSVSGDRQAITWYRGDGTNDVVQLSSLDLTSVNSAPTTYAQFRFVTPEGVECTSISPMRVPVGSMASLPGVDADCRTMPGGTVAGWTIPTPPDSSEYGSPSNPFGPGLPVRVVDSQTFTVVPFEPILSFIYDANVALADTCTSTEVENTAPSRRERWVWVPRTDIALAAFPTQAACTPPGHRLTGWNTNGSGTGTTYGTGDRLPAAWGTDSANRRTLYAVWG